MARTQPDTSGNVLGRQISDLFSRKHKQEERIIQDLVIGETFQRIEPANGWRVDTLFGGNKQVYRNPYEPWNGVSKGPLGPGDHQYFYLVEGRPYTGFFRERVHHRNGSSQTKMTGTMRDGLLQGTVRLYHASDDARLSARGRGSLRAKGSVVNGEMVGDWWFYRPDRQVYQYCLYAADKSMPEVWIEFQQNGKDTMHCVVFEADDLHAWEKKFDEAGHLIYHRILLDYERAGGGFGTVNARYEVREYYPSGQLKMIGEEQIVGHRLEQTGTWRWYAPDGTETKKKEF